VAAGLIRQQTGRGTDIMKNLIARFLKDESGATAIEYGLIAGGISIVIIAGVNVAGPKIDAIFDKIGAALPAQ
jgi:pilus assembly protein Flp/PilA